MSMGGDSAEQVVRLSLEGFEVAARLSGTAAKNVAVILASLLKEEQKTAGKARLTSMIKSGKELKVFSIPNGDLKKFTEQAKRYGVLYCVLREKYNGDERVPVDIISRVEDASKIQRICDRFRLGLPLDKAEIIAEPEKDIAEGKAVLKEEEKTRGERIVEEATGNHEQNKGESRENPTRAETDKSPLSRQSSKETDIHTDKGERNTGEKPSVREKLRRYRAQSTEKNEPENIRSDRPEERPAKRSMNTQTVHKQPARKRKQKDR